MLDSERRAYNLVAPMFRYYATVELRLVRAFTSRSAPCSRCFSKVRDELEIRNGEPLSGEHF